MDLSSANTRSHDAEFGDIGAGLGCGCRYHTPIDLD
jgi:hypothetical protein